MSQQSGSYSSEGQEEETSQEEEYSEEENYQGDESSQENSHALNLKWCLGFNYTLFDGAHN